MPGSPRPPIHIISWDMFSSAASLNLIGFVFIFLHAAELVICLHRCNRHFYYPADQTEEARLDFNAVLGSIYYGFICKEYSCKLSIAE